MGKITKREHEPLRIPQGWTDQARGLVMQIERIFDRLFNRKLSKTDDGWCPKLPEDNDGDKYLKQDGTWACPAYTEVVDSLTSTDATKALSANQGKELNDTMLHRTGDLNENVSGSKRFYNDLTIGRNSRYKRVNFVQYDGNVGGLVFFDTGNAYNQSSNTMSFIEYSPNSPANTGNNGKYEQYQLPAPGVDIDANAAYDIYTTKQEPVLYQAAATTHTFTVNNNSRNVVIFIPDGVSYSWAGIVYGSSTGTVTTAQFYKGSNCTVSTSTNSITFTITTSSSCYVRCIRVRGTPLSNPS